MSRTLASRRFGRSLATLVAATAVLAGCAQIPTSGPVVQGPSPDAGNGPVSIDAQRPKPGASPQDIVQGFLDAMSSYQFGFPIARTYLAPGVDWAPTTTIVYGAGENLTVQGDGSSVVFDAPKIATIEDTGRYTAAAPSEEITVPLRLEKSEGEWRVAAPPTWLLISTLERDANYGQFFNYYPSLDGDLLVPDPVWLPANGEEVPNLLAEQLVNGPSDALGDAVRNAFPAGTAVTGVDIEAKNARVTLTDRALDASPADRTLMAAQLVYTLRQLVGTEVDTVSIMIGGERLEIPDMPATIPVTAYPNLDPLARFAAPLGYAVSGNRVVTVDPDTGDLHTVPGPAGDDAALASTCSATPCPPLSIAVSVDEKTIATVSSDGRIVSTVALADGATPEAVWNGGNVAQPTWDRYGYLWFASHSEDTSGLWRVLPGSLPVKVDAPELERTTVLSTRIAPDGVRIAVVIQDAGAEARLLVGRIRQGKELAATDFVEIAPQVTSVLDVAWLGETDLEVIGNTADRQGSPLSVSIDGSRITQSVKTGTELIAGFSDQPVLAISDGDLSRQVSQISWVNIGEATSVTYPG